MKVIKNINNNVALCLDSKGNEVVVFGKGVGHKSNHGELELSQIERTFYNLDQHYIKTLNEIPFEIYKIAEKVIDYATSKLFCELNSNLLFGLADHINYAIERYQKGILFKLPIKNDVENLFEIEMEIGIYALKLIEEEYHIKMPEDEAAFIALNILNSEYNPVKDSIALNEKTIMEITRIIEESLQIKIDRKSFSYSRFVSHLFYLFKRQNMIINSNNVLLYRQLIVTYPDTYHCVIKIRELIKELKNQELSDEECLYLILHINRLCNAKSV